jgi:hypothetical protein
MVILYNHPAKQESNARYDWYEPCAPYALARLTLYKQ